MKTAHPIHHVHRTSGNGGDHAFSDEMESLKHGFAQLRSDVTDLMQSAVHAGKSGAAAIQDGAGRTVSGIAGTITDGITDLKKSSQRSVKSVKRQMAEYPVASAMIALGAGFILAKFLRRKPAAKQVV